ncbi:hypothetical protein GOP98_19135, partial [Vibrio cholerae]|nr:hypothetical protein [Vibrio cholerae]
MVTVVVFEFCVMRCQPLRRALNDRRNLGYIRCYGSRFIGGSGFVC